jgi:hypothetical protein
MAIAGTLAAILCVIPFVKDAIMVLISVKV